MSAKRNLMIGLGIGAVIGILFAPHKGSKTRRKLSESGQELKDGWNNLKDTLTNAFSTSKNEINNYTEEESIKTPAYISSSMQEEWKA